MRVVEKSKKKTEHNKNSTQTQMLDVCDAVPWARRSMRWIAQVLAGWPFLKETEMAVPTKMETKPLPSKELRPPGDVCDVVPWARRSMCWNAQVLAGWPFLKETEMAVPTKMETKPLPYKELRPPGDVCDVVPWARRSMCWNAQVLAGWPLKETKTNGRSANLWHHPGQLAPTTQATSQGSRPRNRWMHGARSRP
jgi:hypothetical protein